MTVKIAFFCCLLVLALQQYTTTSFNSPQQTSWQREQRLYIRDPYCLRWNGQNCAQCPLRYYLQNGRCTPVNPLCRDFDQNTGACLSCYPGYAVNNGLCAVSDSPYPVNPSNQGNQIGGGSGQTYNSNVGCSAFDQNGNCIRCSDRYYNNANTGTCVKVSDFCRTWNENNGNCVTCYTGFELINGGCFGNYNPGQPLTVAAGANSQSDQSLIIPLSQTQQIAQPQQQFIQVQPQQQYVQPQNVQSYVPYQQSGVDNSSPTYVYPSGSQSFVQPSYTSSQSYSSEVNALPLLQPINFN